MGTEVEGVNPAVRRNLPALGQARNRRGVCRIVTSQPFEQFQSHASVRLAGQKARIERLRLRAVDDDQVGGRPGADAAGEERHREDDDGQAEVSRHGWVI